MNDCRYIQVSLIFVFASLLGCDSSGGIDDFPAGEPSDTTSTDHGHSDTDNPLDPGPVELEYPFSFGTRDGVFRGFLSDLSSLTMLPDTDGMEPIAFDADGKLLITGHQRPVQLWNLSQPVDVVKEYANWYPTSFRTTHPFGGQTEKLVIDEWEHYSSSPDITLFDLDTRETTRLMDDVLPIGVASGGRVITLHNTGEAAGTAYVRLYDPETGDYSGGPLHIPRLEVVSHTSLVTARYRDDIGVLVVSANGKSLAGDFITAVYISEQLGPLEMVFASLDGKKITAIFPASETVLFAHMSSHAGSWLIQMDTKWRDNSYKVLIPSESIPLDNDIIGVLFGD